ncbi:pyroglutamyl-peptidase I [Basilea psittacipulmonis]|uniref:Pyroglutamyl-peptidase I n=1 Tax=Basilea psittacipulmonis DSM 24701 TaxID=1072685 RepID=A0A077DFU9_9BURK|nr:pyroglutamyl-peptidase I [Basilea psittacipulmonis]AIL32232.1 hypothetical protein IX83_01915 [Basilea psittacipulmonis DSM 24701]
MSKTILITAFEKFGGDPINASEEIIRHLEQKQIQAYDIQTRILPCVFDKSIQALEAHIQTLKPEIVICLGQAAGRVGITPEMVAININDARIPDNEGVQAIGTPVIPNAPNAYFSRLPVRSIVQALRQANIPASLSYTAGTFVCNHIFYGLMNMVDRYQIQKAGFIHIPCLHEQVSHQAQPVSSLSLATLLDAMNVILHTTITVDQDTLGAMGSSH